LDKTSDDFRFSASVAAWGQLLRGSKFAGEMDFKQVMKLAEGALGKDSEKYRADFLKLVAACEGLRAK
jgi:Ca-activated chloride channel homolog